MKRILRAKHSGRVIDKGALIPIPKGYEHVNLDAMVESATLQDAVGLLKQSEFEHIADVMPVYEKYHLISIIEAFLERTYFESAVRLTTKRLPGRRRIAVLVGTEADVLGIGMLADMMARKVAVDAIRSVCFMPEKLTAEERELISAANPSSLPQVLSKTAYSSLAKPVQDALESGKDESFDRLARLEVFNQARSIKMPCADNFAYVLGYIIEAETESNNLISIVTGKELGLPEPRIQAAVCV